MIYYSRSSPNTIRYPTRFGTASGHDDSACNLLIWSAEQQFVMQFINKTGNFWKLEGKWKKMWYVKSVGQKVHQKVIISDMWEIQENSLNVLKQWLFDHNYNMNLRYLPTRHW